MSDPSSQPTQPLTDEQLDCLGELMTSCPEEFPAGMHGLYATLSRLRAELRNEREHLNEALAENVRRLGEITGLRTERDGARAVAADAIANADRLRAENTALAAGVLGEIVAERAAQFAKFGEQNHVDGTGPFVKNPDRMSNMEDQSAVARLDCQEAAKAGRLNWMLILREEVYEAFAEEDPAALRTELVQVAAVAATWVDAIDRRALGLHQPTNKEA